MFGCYCCFCFDEAMLIIAFMSYDTVSANTTTFLFREARTVPDLGLLASIALTRCTAAVRTRGGGATLVVRMILESWAHMALKTTILMDVNRTCFFSNKKNRMEGCTAADQTQLTGCADDSSVDPAAPPCWYTWLQRRQPHETVNSRTKTTIRSEL